MTSEPDEMDELDFAFTGEVWHWRGPSPYYFVTVPDEESGRAEGGVHQRDVRLGDDPGPGADR